MCPAHGWWFVKAPRRALEGDQVLVWRCWTTNPTYSTAYFIQRPRIFYSDYIITLQFSFFSDISLHLPFYIHGPCAWMVVLWRRQEVCLKDVGQGIKWGMFSLSIYFLACCIHVGCYVVDRYLYDACVVFKMNDKLCKISNNDGKSRIAKYICITSFVCVYS